MNEPRLIPLPGGRSPDRDASTVRLLHKGDPEGLRRLLIDHSGRVGAALRKEFRQVLDTLQIDEALSQASVRIWRSGSRFDPAKGKLATWFLTIARNCARRILESKLRHAALPLTLALEEQGRPVEAGKIFAALATDSAIETPEASSQNGFVTELYAAIDTLPPQQRAVMLADLAAGGTADTADLAAELETTRNSIYVSRTNGRKALRDALAHLGRDDQPSPRPPEGTP